MTNEDLHKIEVPLDDFIREIAQSAARQVIAEHIVTCPLVISHVFDRMTTLENRFSLLLGLIVGSGILGGTAGAMLAKLL